MKKRSILKRVVFGLLLLAGLLAMGAGGEADRLEAIDPLNCIEKDLAAQDQIIRRQHQLIIDDYERLKRVNERQDAEEALLAAVK